MSVHGAAAPTLQFLGGAGTVTGSKYLIRTDEASVLVDCGLFQGLRELRERNWEPTSFDPATIDAVVITHAHVDHCGYLPRLVAAGYRGPVYMTPATAELARIVLPDCAHLLEEEATYANRKGFSRHHPALPLYTQDDAWRALDLVEPIPTATDWVPAPQVSARFVPAGHILGAACIRLRAGDSGPMIGFSGDLGRASHPFLVGPEPIGDVDVLLVESTYGDRLHAVTDPTDELAVTITRTLDRGGNVLIPAFAVDRTEVMLHHLARLVRTGRIPRDVPVYVDSPMALSALEVYRRAFERHDPDIREGVGSAGYQFAVPGLREVREVEESKALNRPRLPSIVVSASGMATGGRVVHHLAHWLPDARNTVLLVGYQAQGTRGRQLLEGATELKMLGRYVPVRAEIVDFPQFSVHADAAELLDWVAAATRPPDTVFVVHGEPPASAALARSIRDKLEWTAVVPRHGERVRLDRLA